MQDLLAAYGRLGNPKALIEVPRATWTHQDFLVTENVETILHRGIIIPILNKHTSRRSLEKDDEENGDAND